MVVAASWAGIATADTERLSTVVLVRLDSVG